jgi:hypothetical protein
MWLSVDPLVEQTMDAYGYCYQNPIVFIDPDGMSAIVGDDTFIFKDKDNKVTTKTVSTGDDTPNRLFVQDPEANKDTPNRLEQDGMYFEQKMIPSSEYTEDDYVVKMSLGFNSQFDIDRNDYIYRSGSDYSDSKWYQRLGESLSDDPVTIDDIKTVLSRRTNSSAQSGLGIKNTKHTQNRHIDRNKYPEKSKYKKPNQIEKIQKKTINNPNRVEKQGRGRTAFEKDFKRVIGTRGETVNKTVLDRNGKVVTSYPMIPK